MKEHKNTKVNSHHKTLANTGAMLLLLVVEASITLAIFGGTPLVIFGLPILAAVYFLNSLMCLRLT